MTVAPLSVSQETDDLEFFVRQACKYTAKAMVLARSQGQREYSAVLYATLRMFERNDASSPELPPEGW